MKTGIINNCEKCCASYGQYSDNPNSDFSEYWCEIPTFIDGKLQKPKGVCQFCNPKTVYYIENFPLRNRVKRGV